MFYKFATIRNIDDILPAISGWEEFKVIDKSDEGYKVVNYLMTTPDIFDMQGPDDREAAVRRDCRGLIFCSRTGDLMSRSLHKFFNAGERDETQIDKIDLNHRHVIMEKLDGSMVRPLFLFGGIRLATKMGCTDTSNNAETWLVKQADRQKKEDWLFQQIKQGRTPVFEWLSPKNRIVIEYEKEDLVLIAVRVNLTGEYLDIMEHPDIKDVPFTKVPIFPSLKPGAIEQYAAKVSGEEDREGDILSFDNGHKLKFKTMDYLRKHKVKEKVGSIRHVAILILEEELDDVLPILDKKLAAETRTIASNIRQAVNSKVDEIMDQLVLACDKSVYPDRKSVALQFMDQDHNIHKMSRSHIFRLYEKQDELDAKAQRALLHDMVLNTIRNHSSSANRWKPCASWLDLETDKDELEE